MELLRNIKLDDENRPSLSEKRINEKNKKIERLLNEAYGSFSGQYSTVKTISNKILTKIFDDSQVQANGVFFLEEKIPSVGDVSFKINYSFTKTSDNTVRGYSYDDGNKITVTLILTINNKNLITPTFAKTLGHEIMHCFQYKLKRIKGVNKKSMILYHNLLQFYDLAPGLYSELFFYGLYICYSIEANANVSSVSNYLDAVFKDKKDVATKQLMTELSKNETYMDYRTIYEAFNGKNHTNFGEQDLEYIKKCITAPVKDVYDGIYIYLFNKDDFNVDLFVDKNIANIVKVCKKTIEKMQKNICEYLEQGEIDNGKNIGL